MQEYTNLLNHRQASDIALANKLSKTKFESKESLLRAKIDDLKAFTAKIDEKVKKI